jgi:hypothetical protein
MLAAQFAWVPLAEKEEVAANPVHVGDLGAPAVVPKPNTITKLFEQPWGARRVNCRFCRGGCRIVHCR